MVPFQPIDTFKTQWLFFYNTAFLPFAKRKIFSRTKVGFITLYRPLYIHWAISNQFSFHFLTCFHVVVFFFRARFYAAEIASAIGYLHALSIIYRYYFHILHDYQIAMWYSFSQRHAPNIYFKLVFLILVVNLYYVHYLVRYFAIIFSGIWSQRIFF